MASSNLDLVRSIYADLERGDFSRADWADPEIEYVMVGGPEPGSGTGLAGMATGWGEVLSAWEDFRVEVDDYREVDDERVLALIHFRGRGKTSGLEIATKGAALFQLRGGKVTRIVHYWDRERALGDLGLTGQAMSRENIILHRRADVAFNTRDVEAYIAHCDPEIELHSSVTVPGGAVYSGHGGVRRWHQDLEDVFGDAIRVEPEAYFDLGEQTMSFHALRGRGGRSGAEIAEPYAHVCRWRAGRIIYFKGYSHRQEALRELGVTEDELEPIDP